MKASLLFDTSHLRFEGNGIADINAEMLYITNVNKKRLDFFTKEFIETYGKNDCRYTGHIYRNNFTKII